MIHASKPFGFFFAVALLVAGCATSGTDTTTDTTSTIVNILAALLGVTPDQATAGAGSLLGLASEKLSAQDYAKVAAAIPGAPNLVTKAGTLTGLGSNFGSYARVATALGRMGLTSNQVHLMATDLSDIAAKSGGDAVRTLLLGVLK